MANLGKETNQLAKGGPGGGLGSAVVNENAPLISARPNCFVNPKEASARRGQARGSDGQGKSGRNETQGR